MGKLWIFCLILNIEMHIPTESKSYKYSIEQITCTRVHIIIHGNLVINICIMVEEIGCHSVYANFVSLAPNFPSTLI